MSKPLSPETYVSKLLHSVSTPPSARSLMPAEELIRKLDCTQLGTLARDILDAETIPAEEVALLHEWLRQAISDSGRASQQWGALAEFHGIGRDEHVSSLWRRLLGDHEQPVNLKTHAEVHWCPWSYYERHLFSWFLGRFNLSGAWGIFPTSRFTLFLCAILVPAVALSTAGALRGFSLTSSALLLLGFLSTMALLTWQSEALFHLPSYALVQSLLPRLAAAVAIGYLFLANAPQVVRILYDSQRPPWHYALATFFLLASAFLYILFHVSRRVYPALRPVDLCLRAGYVLALAVAYSSAELLVAGPLLFSRSVLNAAGSTGVLSRESVHWYHLVLCAAVALNLGVVLQLAWDDKPLTEPL